MLPLKVQRPVACCAHAAATVECKQTCTAGALVELLWKLPPEAETRTQLYCSFEHLQLSTRRGTLHYRHPRR